MSEFVKVAQVSDLADGEMKSVSVGSRDVLLAKMGDDFFAVDNACPHVGAPLSQGHLRDGIVTCPLHGWQYDVTNGEGKMPPGSQIGCFKVKVDGDDVFVAEPE